MRTTLEALYVHGACFGCCCFLPVICLELVKVLPAACSHSIRSEWVKIDWEMAATARS